MTQVIVIAYLVVAISLIQNFQSVNARNNKYVTCGSVLKLLNSDYKVRLHSHDVKYGTGSGQQSVTATEVQEDVNSHWAIKAATGKHCERGEPVKCGDTIRLHHLATNKNLHSHHFQSPLSGNQEISAYGDDNGVGDTGDHWMVVCSGDSWLRDSKVKLRHIDTDAYLSISGRTFGRPINGQMEVVGISNPYSGSDWTVAEGLFIHPSEKESTPRHTEL
ncbi:stromal cell-derived factor 2 isoform X2 [Toxorhynchites rutilus septentrionalis]|uniref:stromal cell-derived factor 2 isoform X2 n=1 Tax=Toxorhynchites rutilus septentrionalis TaxID=329112 RepID=UPI002479EEAD|nr:stromal cell-derived factor 2 isoform X2 [Toxorhynchites rutilus septentrionalis]